MGGWVAGGSGEEIKIKHQRCRCKSHDGISLTEFNRVGGWRWILGKRWRPKIILGIFNVLV